MFSKQVYLVNHAAIKDILSNELKGDHNEFLIGAVKEWAELFKVAHGDEALGEDPESIYMDSGDGTFEYMSHSKFLILITEDGSVWKTVPKNLWDKEVL